MCWSLSLLMVVVGGMLASKQGTTPPLHRAPLHCHNLALISVQQQQPKPVHLLSPPAQCALSLSLPPPALSISLCDISLPLSCAIILLGSSSPLLSNLVLPLPSLLSLSLSPLSPSLSYLLSVRRSALLRPRLSHAILLSSTGSLSAAFALPPLSFAHS